MKLPQLSGSDLIKILQTKGFVVVRQKGSHIRLEKVTAEGIVKVTVPHHNTLKKGTLHHILKATNLTIQDIS